ncbi:MAG: tyrosine-protein phosphatase [Phycisphaerae bacterium]|nr:tyrosine-protein phosphatase [Phycisphaerae bacterium]
MFKQIKRLLKTSIFASVIVIAASCVSTTPRQASTRPAGWAVSLEKEGLGNFHKVSDDLYRGEQPTADGIAELKRMGVKTIVDLRSGHSDKDEIGDIQIGYEQIPMEAWDPKEEDVVKFLKIVTDKEKTPIFVHCKRGADRTGFMCAAYRVAVCSWSKEDAIDEMTHGGYRFYPIWKGLVDYLEKFDVEKVRQEAGIGY